MAPADEGGTGAGSSSVYEDLVAQDNGVFADDSASAMDNSEADAGDEGEGENEAEAEAEGVPVARYQPLWVRLACILINFLIEMYDQIRIVPEIALYERSVCRSYYLAHDPSVVIGGPRGSVPERLCKIGPVQQQLASLRGWKAFFDGVAIFIAAVPMGALADRFGRKKVLASSIFGPIAATLWVLFVGFNVFGGGNIELVWFSSAFYLFGNLSSANATCYAMAADACPPSKRSQYFYYLYSTFLVCELFAPALASVTIDRNLLIPFGLGLAALLLCYPILVAMPETHRHDGKMRLPKSSRDLPDSEDSQDSETDALLSSASDLGRAPETNANNNSNGDSNNRNSTSFLAVLRERNLLLALVVLFVGALRQATVSVLLQYAAQRFLWPISQTAMLVSAIAAMNIVLFLFIMPQAIVFLASHWHVPSQVVDYTIVSVSLGILAAGALLMGLAPSATWLVPAVLLFAAGYGTRVAVLSLVTVWTSEDMRARTFAIAQIVENIGRMCADPALLKVFVVSLRLEGEWRGLPFFVGAAGFSFGALAWRFVRVSPGNSV